MSDRSPYRWTIYLLVILLASFGLMTGFSLDESATFTYREESFTLDHSVLLIGMIFGLILSLFIGLGIRGLALYGRTRRSWSKNISYGLNALTIVVLGAVIYLIALSSAPTFSSLHFGVFIYAFGIVLFYSKLSLELKHKLKKRRKKRKLQTN